MAGTAMTRKTFYVHFADLGDLIVRLVTPFRAELDDAIAAWIASPDPIASGGRALDTAARLYLEHGALLRAVWRTADNDPTVDLARRELMEPLITAGARLLTSRRGLSVVEARAIAQVLATMNVHALLELRPDVPSEELESTTAAIRAVWHAVVLDGPAPSPA
jgi:AcrR family transcriptional regulator